MRLFYSFYKVLKEWRARTVDKHKLVILESADNLGKSTISKQLSTMINASILQQPSASNTLGFLRGIVKGKTSISPFERQLLHTISHTVDLYETMLYSDTNIVMDRSYISALIYGELSGLDEFELSLIYDIHHRLYSKLQDKYDVTICIMTRSRPFASKDNSFYEKTLNWDDINNGYLKVFENQKSIKQSYFTKTETIKLIDRDKMLNDNEICEFILSSKGV